MAWAFYKGKKYGSGFGGGRTAILCTSNDSEIENGFFPSHRDSDGSLVYVKNVSYDDLDEFYAISKTAVYKGVECVVCSEDMKGNFYL